MGKVVDTFQSHPPRDHRRATAARPDGARKGGQHPSDLPVNIVGFGGHHPSEIPVTFRRNTHYDHGDGWENRVTVERLLPPDPGVKSPQRLDGAHACPPEDVGGPPGYIEFLEAINDPAHDEHDSMLKWCGGSFEPTAFRRADLTQGSVSWTTHSLLRVTPPVIPAKAGIQ